MRFNNTKFLWQYRIRVLRIRWNYFKHHTRIWYQHWNRIYHKTIQKIRVQIQIFKETPMDGDFGKIPDQICFKYQTDFRGDYIR